MRIFISHSSKEAGVAAEVCDLLEHRSYSCFLAPRDIRPGCEYAEEIMRGIDSSDCMLLLLSEGANASPHVLREVERAVSKKIPILVYRLEEVELTKSMEYFLMTHQWILPDSEKGHEVILQGLHEFAGQREERANGRFGGKIPILCLAVTGLVLLTLCIWYFGFCRPEKTQGNMDHPRKEEQQMAVVVQPGDGITFGTYMEQPILWRVLSLSEDGRQALVVSDAILTMKAYDAAEGGQYNYYEGEFYGTVQRKELSLDLQRSLRGSNSWKDSNIRTWLNSFKENVTYEDQAPCSKAMADRSNGYNTEPGFLNGFTQKERDAILTTRLETQGVITEDKVFLLSSEELKLLESADVTKYPIPTEKAVGADESDWYQIYAVDLGVKDYYWWLRDAETSETNACECYVVGNSYADGKIMSMSVGLEGFGIRPAMTIDLSYEGIQVQK